MRLTTRGSRWVHRLLATASAIAVVTSVVAVDGTAAAAGKGGGGGGTTLQAPTVSSVSPATGTAAGGTPNITIVGTNLLDPTGATRTVVKFGPNAADPAKVVCAIS